jgi:hypothetical protein
VTKGSFYERLADNGDAFLCDDDYAHLYAPTMGRPSIPPSIMLRAMLLATYERVRSDAEIARNTRVDLDWKAAMGVDDDFGGIAPTIFSLCGLAWWPPTLTPSSSRRPWRRRWQPGSSATRSWWPSSTPPPCTEPERSATPTSSSGGSCARRSRRLPAA